MIGGLPEATEGYRLQEVSHGFWNLGSGLESGTYDRGATRGDGGLPSSGGRATDSGTWNPLSSRDPMVGGLPEATGSYRLQKSGHGFWNL